MDAPRIARSGSEPRAVPVAHAFAWYEEAMHLFKRAPLRWCLLGLATLATEFGLQFVPDVGVGLSKILVPVVACGMLLAAAAVDRGALPEWRHAVAAFGAPAGALAAIIGAEIVVFFAQAIAAYALADVNLLTPGGDADAQLTTGQLVEIVALGTLLSLPFAFVPFAALFEQATFAAAFARSWRGFALNALPLAVYGLLSLVLIGVGLLTAGIALVVVFPLTAAASYAAWKDIYSVSTVDG